MPLTNFHEVKFKKLFNTNITCTCACVCVSTLSHVYKKIVKK